MIFKNSVRINRKPAVSLYTKAGDNMKRLGTVTPRIGASLSSINKLMDYSEELKLLMSSIIGVDKADVNWGSKVSEYLNSISVPIKPDGKLLDISLKFSIDDDSRAIYKKNLKELTDIKVDTQEDLYNYCTKLGFEAGEINDFTVLKYAAPVNPSDYLLYLHCLSYSHVANRVEDSDKSTNIRFYIYREADEMKSKKRDAEIQAEVANLYGNAVKSSEGLTNAYYIYSANDIMSGNFKVNSVNYAIMVGELSSALSSNPSRLRKALKVKNKNEYRSVLEFIANGVLNVLPNTTTILTPDGDILGKNLDSAVSALFDEKNEILLKKSKALLKSLSK